MKIKVSFFFAWYDAWLGFYYDKSRRVLYFCPLPCFVFKFQAVEQSVQADGFFILDDGTPEFMKDKLAMVSRSRRRR